jgi:hypothetical protein
MPLLVVSDLSDEELARCQMQQRWLVHGAPPGTPAARLLDAPAVVYIQATLHSTEVAASMMLPSLVHWLSTSMEDEARQIRANNIVLIMPSANPDGLDLVHEWNESTRGGAFEGSSPPELYQRYAGHDNNRDWFMLSLKETRVVSRVLYEEWFPEVVLDIHQMGAYGARMFVPPCSDPVNENVPALVCREIDLVGAHMAMALQEAGLQGVVQDVVYDNYWAGGARNTPCRHNMVGIITETAAAKLAHSLEVAPDKLRGHGAGLPEYKRQGNFPDPWPGGRWTLSDAMHYQRISTQAMLKLTAEQSQRFVRNFAEMNARCRAAPPAAGPAAFVIPAQQDDHALARLAENLLNTGIRIHRTTAPCEFEGSALPVGSLVVRLDQAFRNHAKDVLEIQRFPELKASQDGEILRPYDTAGWSLPIQFGLRSQALRALPDELAPLEEVSRAWPESSLVKGRGKVAVFSAQSNAAFILANRLRHLSGLVLSRHSDGRFIATSESEVPWERALAGLHLEVTLSDDVPAQATSPLPSPRVGIFQSWPASMDGGWTRLVLEEHGYEPSMLTAKDILNGALNRYDALVLPDVSSSTLDDGPGSSRLPELWHGGLKGEGVERLRSFVEGGGRLIAMGSSSLWAARALNWGLVNGLADAPLKGKQGFACPGSLLEVSPAPAHDAPAGSVLARLARATPVTGSVFFEGSMALAKDSSAATHSGAMHSVLNFNGKLASGFLARGELLAGCSALMAAHIGRGELSLFAFRPQHRSQTLGTFRLLFEALEAR